MCSSQSGKTPEGDEGRAEGVNAVGLSGHSKRGGVGGGWSGPVRSIRPRRTSDSASGGEMARLHHDMFENAVWGMFQTTADGQYLSANAALARIYGYESPSALLVALTDIGRQLYVDVGRRDEFVRLMRAQGAISGFESRILRRDGAVIWISESCREVRDQDGGLLYYEGSVEEITQRKTAEAELAAAKAQAEAANRAKSAFLMHMSHELRTPLNAILGFEQLIRDGASVAEPHMRYAADIHDSGARLLDMVNDVLILAELEAGRVQRQDDIVPLNRFLAGCAASVAEAAGKSLDLDLPVESPVLSADPHLLRVAVLKLLSNAVKFSAPEGRIVLSTSSLATGGVEITVADSGIGMDLAELPRALQPFRQLDGGLARRYEGMGLGLPIARALVELHDGRLALESRLGEGTRARLILPASRVCAAD